MSSGRRMAFAQTRQHEAAQLVSGMSVSPVVCAAYRRGGVFSIRYRVPGVVVRRRRNVAEPPASPPLYVCPRSKSPVPAGAALPPRRGCCRPSLHMVDAVREEDTRVVCVGSGEPQPEGMPESLRRNVYANERTWQPFFHHAVLPRHRQLFVLPAYLIARRPVHVQHSMSIRKKAAKQEIRYREASGVEGGAAVLLF